MLAGAAVLALAMLPARSGPDAFGSGEQSRDIEVRRAVRALRTADAPVQRGFLDPPDGGGGERLSTWRRAEPDPGNRADVPHRGELRVHVRSAHGPAIEGALVQVRELPAPDAPAHSAERVLPPGDPRVLLSESECRELGIGQRGRTDAQGRVRFDRLPCSLLEIHVAHQGWCPASASIALEAGTVPEHHVRLTPARERIAGRVVDPDGRGLAGAFVHAVPRKSPEARPSAEARTDPDGCFVLTGLGPGIHALTATAFDFLATELPDVPAGGERIQIVLRQGARIEGRSVDAYTGHPVEAARVFVEALDADGAPRQTGSQLERPVPGDASCWLLAGLAPGRYRVVAHADGFATSCSEPIDLEEAEMVYDLVLRMNRGGRIAGRLVVPDADGPPPTLRVEALAAGTPTQDDEALASTTSDPQGRFLLEHLPPGHVRIVVRQHDQLVARSHPLRVSEGSMARDVEVLVVPSASLRGRTDGCAGNAPVRRLCLEPMDDGARYVTTLAPDGTFRLDRLLPGRYRLQAMSPEAAVVSRMIDLRAGERRELLVATPAARQRSRAAGR